MMPSIETQTPFEYKLLMRVRQLKSSGVKVQIDLDSEELQVLGRVESLNRSVASATAPIGELIQQ